MPSIKDIKDSLKDLGITKGLSKLTKSQLEELLKRAKEPHKVNTLQDRRDLLLTISKKNLLKVISMIRIKRYYHLKHDELVDLIASQYWADFSTRWFTQAPNELLPNKANPSALKMIPSHTKQKRKPKAEEEQKEDDKKTKTKQTKTAPKKKPEVKPKEFSPDTNSLTDMKKYLKIVEDKFKNKQISTEKYKRIIPPVKKRIEELKKKLQTKLHQKIQEKSLGRKPKREEEEEKESKEEEKEEKKWTLKNAKSTIDKLNTIPTRQAKKYIIFLLNKFQGNLEFYKQNKSTIDKLAPPILLKKLGFTPKVFL